MEDSQQVQEPAPVEQTVPETIMEPAVVTATDAPAMSANTTSEQIQKQITTTPATTAKAAPKKRQPRQPKAPVVAAKQVVKSVPVVEVEVVPTASEIKTDQQIQQSTIAGSNSDQQFKEALKEEEKVEQQLPELKTKAISKIQDLRMISANLKAPVPGSDQEQSLSARLQRNIDNHIKWNRRFKQNIKGGQF